jgi:ABC-type multidrug transport system ATPase subunit
VTPGSQPVDGAAPATASFLRAEHLTRRYGAAVALRDVGLTLSPGDRVALLGPNGAGKTTLLRVLATSLRPERGALIVGGVDALRHPSHARLHLGLVGHQTFLYGDLTVRENLRFYGRLYRVLGLEARIDEVLATVALENRGDHLVRTLSRGMQQRAAVARAILHRPWVLLLDEPETGLDDASQATLRDLLRDWAAGGRAVLVSSHRLEWVEELVDRAIVLREGEVVEEVTVRPQDSASLASRYRELVGTALAMR